MQLKHSFLKTTQVNNEIASLHAEEHLSKLIALLDDRPDAGKVLPGGDGLRKIRMGLPGRGKSGGARIIYYDICDERTILLLFVYAKNEMQNLSPSQLHDLVQVKRITVAKFKEASHVKSHRPPNSGYARTSPKRHT